MSDRDDLAALLYDCFVNNCMTWDAAADAILAAGWRFTSESPGGEP